MEKAEKVNKSGQPKKIKSGQELIELWEDFCSYVVGSGYMITPTFTEFKIWICENHKQIDRRTIYTAINEYFPDTKSEIDRIRADIIAQGTMVGIYQPSMAIFSLKNWCGWTDKVESHNINTDSITIDFGEFDNAD
ncbi:MAG: hypothetical protein R3Y09_06740 [Clostridia bacterium]